MANAPAFSSRARFLAFSLSLSLLISTAMIAGLELALLPSIERDELDRRESLPLLLATSNQTAIMQSDLVELSTNLEQAAANLQASGVRYILVQDAEGTMIGQAFTSDWGAAERKQVVDELRKATAAPAVAATTIPQTDVVGDTAALGDQERAAIGGNESAHSAAVTLPEGALGKIMAKRAVRLAVAGQEILDLALPILAGSSPIGGVRVGVVDRLSATLRAIRVAAYSSAALVIVLAAVGSWFLARSVDVRFAMAGSEQLNQVQREAEERVRKVEAMFAKKEEENPVTPSEFLSLLDFARRISGTLDYNEALDMGIHSCLQVMNVRDVSIFVLDPESNELVGRVGHDENGFMDQAEMSKIRVPVGKGDLGAAAEFGTTTTIDTPRPGSGVVSALVSRGRTIGVVLVRNKLSGRPFAKKDQTVLRILSGLLANAMETAAIFHHMSYSQHS